MTSSIISIADRLISANFTFRTSRFHTSKDAICLQMISFMDMVRQRHACAGPGRGLRLMPIGSADQPFSLSLRGRQAKIVRSGDVRLQPPHPGTQHQPCEDPYLSTSRR
jgi:hypothetical protein